jgi:Rieske Fe-S protein
MKVMKDSAVPDNSSPPDEDTDEKGMSRRAFLKFLFAASTLLSLIPFVPMYQFLLSKKTEPSQNRKKITNVSELAEGSTKVFFYPGEEDIDRSFLIHLPHELADRARDMGKDEFIVDGFVALNTVCTHLQCYTEFPEEDQVVCPCHGGYFNIVDGTVRDGPPPRPLPMINLEIEEETGDIYAVELIGEIGYGRE